MTNDEREVKKESKLKETKLHIVSDEQRKTERAPARENRSSNGDESGEKSKK